MKKLIVLSACLCGMSAVSARVVHVAVAANFTAPMKDLQPIYEKLTGDQLRLSFGGTGAFYTQIKNGAPFDILLAADSKTPTKLVQEGIGVSGSQFTYAVGRLVLWSAQEGVIQGRGSLKENQDIKLAIANPKLAPYGQAGYEVLNHLQLTSAWKGKIVEGESIGRTYQFVASGNAKMGFVAMSQCTKNGQWVKGSGWIVPQEYYQPITQDAVLLKKTEENEGAKRFMNFLQTNPEVQKIRRMYGYGQAQ